MEENRDPKDKNKLLKKDSNPISNFDLTILEIKEYVPIKKILQAIPEIIL